MNLEVRILKGLVNRVLRVGPAEGNRRHSDALYPGEHSQRASTGWGLCRESKQYQVELRVGGFERNGVNGVCPHRRRTLTLSQTLTSVVRERIAGHCLVSCPTRW
jgi:hypothetical protein